MVLNLSDIIGANRNLDKVAIVDLLHPHMPRNVSYSELDALCAASARGLQAQGLRQGDRVGVMARNRTEYLTSLLGVLRAGMIAVPINQKYTAEIIHFICADAKLSFILTDDACVGLCPSGVPRISFDDPRYADFLREGRFDPIAMSASAIGLVLYTSGSTGRPKGVPLTHSGQLWTLAARSRGMERPEDDRLVIAAPLCHMNGLIGLLFAIYSHATAILLPQFSAEIYLRAIEEHRCTRLTGVPTMMAMLLQQPDVARTNVSSVRTIAMGSAPASAKLFQRLKAAFPGAAVVNGYGTTEAGAVTFGPHPRGLPRPEGSLGHPLTDIDVRLDDGESDDSGVLVLRTPAVAPGYLNLPERTREVFRDGWYTTGDVMRRDENGFFYFVRRNDDMIICGGENIHPVEVEQMLERHPEIDAACVVPVPDEIKGQKPVVFVVLRAGSDLREDEIKRFALANGPAFQHPRRVYFRDRLPLAGTNKTDRKGLEMEAVALHQAAQGDVRSASLTERGD